MAKVKQLMNTPRGGGGRKVPGRDLKLLPGLREGARRKQQPYFVSLESLGLPPTKAGSQPSAGTPPQSHTQHR